MQQIPPGAVAVIFMSRRNDADTQGYADAADAMRRAAERFPGYVGILEQAARARRRGHHRQGLLGKTKRRPAPGRQTAPMPPSANRAAPSGTTGMKLVVAGGGRGSYGWKRPDSVT